MNAKKTFLLILSLFFAFSFVVMAVLAFIVIDYQVQNDAEINRILATPDTSLSRDYEVDYEKVQCSGSFCVHTGE